MERGDRRASTDDEERLGGGQDEPEDGEEDRQRVRSRGDANDRHENGDGDEGPSAGPTRVAPPGFAVAS